MKKHLTLALATTLLALGAAQAQITVSNWVVTDTDGGATGTNRTATGIVYKGAGNDGFAAGNLNGTASIGGLGDSVTFTFDVSFAGVADQNNGFLFGIYNSNSTVHTGDITGNNNSDYRDEYGFTWRIHTGATNGQNRLDIMNSAKAVTSSNTLTTFNSSAALDTDNTQPGGIKAASTTYSLALTITGTATGLEIGGTIFDGTDLIAIPGTDGNTTTTTAFGNTIGFDTIAFGLNNAVDSQTITLSDISVTAVPEPSTYVLLAGFLALGGVMLRRRLRQ